MPCVSEFGIINNFEKNKDYSKYELEEYNCISVDDGFINDWWSDLITIKTYHHCYDRPNISLERLAIDQGKYVIHYGV